MRRLPQSLLVSLSLVLVPPQLALCQKTTPSATGPKTTTEALTADNLTKHLRELKLQVDEQKLSNGQLSWRITTKRDKWEYEVVILPVGTKDKLTGLVVVSRLGEKVPNPNTLSSVALLKILQKNIELAPYNFAFHKQTGYLCVQREYRLVDVQKLGLKSALDDFFKTIRETHPLWKTSTLVGASGSDGSLKLTGTFWEGTEKLQGFGKLSFRFNAAGKAIMIDSQDTTSGIWVRADNTVTLTFFDGKVIYRGTLRGKRLSGTAQSSRSNRSWSFSVELKGSNGRL